jgi:hypothetical protein
MASTVPPNNALRIRHRPGVLDPELAAQTMLASNTAITATLRNGGPHTIGVTVTASSHIVVTIDGAQVLDTAVTLPSRALVAFTGGTGSLTDTHAVANR